MPSFDVGSSVDMQEVKNALENSKKEIEQRYDFRGSKSSFELKEKEALIIIMADDRMQMDALKEIFLQKAAKRGLSMKAFEFAEAEAAGGDMLKMTVTVKNKLDAEQLKKLNKLIKESGIKASSQIQGDQVRVTGKKRDDLQGVIQYLKTKAVDLPLTFVNFRD